MTAIIDQKQKQTTLTPPSSQTSGGNAVDSKTKGVALRALEVSFVPVKTASQPLSKGHEVVVLGRVHWKGKLWELSQSYFLDHIPNEEERISLQRNWTQSLQNEGKSFFNLLQEKVEEDLVHFRDFTTRKSNDEGIDLEIHAASSQNAKEIYLSKDDFTFEERQYLYRFFNPGSLLPLQKNSTPPGFKNSGNTCFLSSYMNLMASDPALRKKLLKTLPEHNPLRKALAAYESRDRVVIPLDELYNALDEDLQGHLQQDVHEAFLDLTNEFSQKCLEESFYEVTVTREGSSYKRPYRGIPEVSIQPNKDTSLPDLIFNALKSEGREDDDPVLRDGREVRVQEKAEIFQRAPKNLFVHVRRTRRDGTKDETPIQAFEKIALLKEANYQKGPDSTQYLLQGFSVHLGKSAESGHFVTYYRDDSDPENPKFWRSSDEEVRPVSKNAFFKAAEQAYLLNFSKEDIFSKQL